MIHAVRFPELGISFQVNTIAFQIGNFAVYWYGIIIAAGFLLATLYAMRSSQKMQINQDHLFDGILFGLIAGVIGARLYYVIFFPGDLYIKDPLAILDIRDGGLGIYGGIIAALCVAIIVAKWHKMKIGAVLDIASLGFLIGQGVGRWANFINQEAFGDATNLPWGMRSDATELIVPNANVHPCFFYESMLCFIGFVLLHFFTRKYRRFDGQTFILYIVWYGITRFFVEGLRTDSLMVPGIDIRVSQLVSLLSVVAGIITLIILRKRTALSGCGSKEIMELNGIDLSKKVEKVAKKEDKEVLVTESTLFKGEKYLYDPSVEENKDEVHEENEEEEAHEDE